MAWRALTCEQVRGGMTRDSAAAKKNSRRAKPFETGWVLANVLAIRAKDRECLRTLVIRDSSSGNSHSFVNRYEPVKENVGGSTQAMKHKNDARSLVMISYDKIEPMIWERF